MNAQKFTQKSLETIQLANNLALENNNMQIEQEHLLYALLKIDQSLIAQLLKKMGKDPEKLREQMQSGQMDGILGGLSPAQRAQIQGFMNNPAAVQQFLGNPKVQQLLRGLMGRQ